MDPETSRSATGVVADEHDAEPVLARLARIERLQRDGARPAELLAELRLLEREALAWSRSEGGEAGEAAVLRLRCALARDLIEA